MTNIDLIEALQQLVANDDERGLCEYWTCGVSCGKTGVVDEPGF